MKSSWSLLLILLVLISCKREEKTPEPPSISDHKTDHQLREVTKATIAPTVDGNANDPIWELAKWQPIDQKWLGDDYTSDDFSGRYKLSWTPEGLYLLAEITDDTILDQNQDPLTLWWDDDCLEIFIDADNSGGEHQFNHNAFAYHVALDGNVVDLAPGEIPTLYNSHVQSKIGVLSDNTRIWECKITLYDDTYKDGGVNDQKILNAGQKIGFALAYCDNDASPERENFIGSVAVKGRDKNRGWIDAGIFGTLQLTE